MSYARALLRDLVDKKLWPIALLLVAGVVAVPLALSKPGPAASPAAPAAVAVTPAVPALQPPGSATVSLAPPGLAGVPGGVARDPFAPQHAPAPTSSSASGAGALAQSAAAGRTLATASTAVGGAGGTSTAAPSSPASASPAPKPAAAPAPAATITVVFGRVGETMRVRTLEPLTALPSASNPVLIYLGLLKDRTTATFLVSSDGRLSGDGKCRPSANSCETLLLAPHTTEYIQFPHGQRYRLHYRRVGA